VAAKSALVPQLAAAVFISARAVEMRRIWCKLAPRKIHAREFKQTAASAAEAISSGEPFSPVYKTPERGVQS
jgi:hypothetical protein